MYGKSIWYGFIARGFQITNAKYQSRVFLLGLPWWSSGKESAFQCRGCGFNPWSGN